MNSAQKELLNLLRLEISNEKKFLVDKVGPRARIVRPLVTAHWSRYYDV